MAMRCAFSTKANCHRQISASSRLIACAAFFQRCQKKLIGQEFFSPAVDRKIGPYSPLFALKSGQPRKSSPETIAILASPQRLEAARESSSMPGAAHLSLDAAATGSRRPAVGDTFLETPAAVIFSPFRRCA